VVSSVKVGLEIGRTSRWCVTMFAETLRCYGHDSTRRQFRTAVEYRPKMVPVRHSDTLYVLPRRRSSTYESYVDVMRDSERPKLYQSSVTFSNVVVVGLRKLSDVQRFPDGNAW